MFVSRVGDNDAVPVFRPVLPRAAQVAIYLAGLDETRIYANRGALVLQLEARLARRFGLRDRNVLCVASGTAALIGAVLATAGRARPERPLCLCPGYTFVAAAHVAEQCGYRVHLVDVDPHFWAPDPARLRAHGLLARTGLVIATAPYGRALDHAAWERFRDETGVPVVIDAAAGVEHFADRRAGQAGNLPVALSFHATKPFATGEGGAIVCRAQETLRAAAAATNFGFDGLREATGPGTNGKMSEYHAAVGLAELDGWAAKRDAFRRVADSYTRHAAARGIVIHAAPEIGSNYALLEAADAAHAVAAEAALSASRIGTRRWYGRGLHRDAYFRAAGRDKLPVAEALGERLIGLPVAPDLDEATVARIVACVPRA